MIRVKKWATKKTKVHVTYEFDHDGATHQRNTTFAIKDFNVIDKKTLYIRVRGLVNSERLKMSKPKEDDEFFKLGGMAKAREEGTSGSNHDKVVYGKEE